MAVMLVLAAAGLQSCDRDRSSYCAVVVTGEEQFTEYGFPNEQELTVFANRMPKYRRPKAAYYDPAHAYFQLTESGAGYLMIKRVRLQKAPGMNELPPGRLLGLLVVKYEVLHGPYGKGFRIEPSFRRPWDEPEDPELKEMREMLQQQP